jgi:hypothetical protein
VYLRGVHGLLSAAAAEDVVVAVSQELLASAVSLDDPTVAAAEAVLQLLPETCQVGDSAASAAAAVCSVGVAAHVCGFAP